MSSKSCFAPCDRACTGPRSEKRKKNTAPPLGIEPDFPAQCFLYLGKRRNLEVRPSNGTIKIGIPFRSVPREPSQKNVIADSTERLKTAQNRPGTAGKCPHSRYFQAVPDRICETFCGRRRIEKDGKVKLPISCKIGESSRRPPDGAQTPKTI